MSDAVHIPMDTWLKLLTAEDEEVINEKEFRRNIGCLRYFIHTKSDLAQSVGVLSRYMHDPRASHGLL